MALNIFSKKPRKSVSTNWVNKSSTKSSLLRPMNLPLTTNLVKMCRYIHSHGTPFRHSIGTVFHHLSNVLRCWLRADTLKAESHILEVGSNNLRESTLFNTLIGEVTELTTNLVKIGRYIHYHGTPFHYSIGTVFHHLSNVRRCWLAMPLGAGFLRWVLACRTIEKKTKI